MEEFMCCHCHGEKEYDPSKSAPEFSFYHKVSAFFEDDEDIDVGEIDERNYEFTITVHNRRKYETLKKVLNIPKQARRLVVHIECDEDSRLPAVSEAELAYLLEKNKYFSRYVNRSRYVDGEDCENGLTPAVMKFVLMKPEVVQYYDDIFNNPAGRDTKTAEQLARELFKGCRCNITSDLRD